MIEFHQLFNLIDTRVKNNIKEGDYLMMMTLIYKIYQMKNIPEDFDSDEDTNDYGGQYC